MEEKQVLRVLSLDGGGIRGIISASMLVELEKRTGKRISELFDILVGTSTGGIMALLLTHPTANYTAEDVLKFYTGDDAKKIFKKKLINLPLDSVKFPSKNIESVLQNKFKSVCLGDAIKPVIITSYDTVTQDDILFSSLESRYQKYKMWEIARATSAAPTYFEAFSLDNMCLIDGGLWSNNPALYGGMIEVEKLFPHHDLIVTSLGTGATIKSVSYNKLKKWNKLNWAENIFDISSNGQSQATDYSIRKLDHCKSYYRFQLSLSEKESDMDNVSSSNINNLINVTNKAIRGNWNTNLENLLKEIQ